MTSGSLEICAVMVLCTSHIDAKTLKELDRWEDNYRGWDSDHWISKLNCGPATYGYFFRARPEDLTADTPESIKNAIDYAYKRGISWLHYDVDGEEVPDLEVYEH